MNKERMREILKRLRDFILCCKKLLMSSKKLLKKLSMMKKKIFKNYIWLIKKPKTKPI